MKFESKNFFSLLLLFTSHISDTKEAKFSCPFHVFGCHHHVTRYRSYLTQYNQRIPRFSLSTNLSPSSSAFSPRVGWVGVFSQLDTGEEDREKGRSATARSRGRHQRDEDGRGQVYWTLVTLFLILSVEVFVKRNYFRFLYFILRRFDYTFSVGEVRVQARVYSGYKFVGERSRPACDVKKFVVALGDRTEVSVLSTIHFKKKLWILEKSC